MGVERF